MCRLLGLSKKEQLRHSLIKKCDKPPHFFHLETLSWVVVVAVETEADFSLTMQRQFFVSQKAIPEIFDP